MSVSIRTWSASALFLFFTVLYISTMLPGIGWEDAPEMALAVDCLGIPHSPGFPLFVLAARVIRTLGADSGAKAGAILAAFSVAGAAAALCWFVAKRHGTVLGVVIGFTLGISPPVWNEACRAEVYGLHLFLATMLLVSSGGRSTIRHSFMTGYILILGVITHPSAVALLPLIFRSFRSKPKVMATLSGMALAGSMLLYLPIRSSCAPFLDWGNSSTLGGFVWLVSLQEFAGDFASGYLIPGGSLGHAIASIGRFLSSALPPLVLGLSLVGLPLLAWRWAAVPTATLALIGLTGIAGGGPDTVGYLLPLIPMVTLSAANTVPLLRIPKLPLTLTWLVALTLLIVPNLRSLDHSMDESAGSYQEALAANTESRVLFTDNTPDWFLLLEHSFRNHCTSNVVFTPYLHLSWYRSSLDPRLMEHLPPQPDPPYELVERAARGLGIEPVYSFSSLPSGALGILSPLGWVFQTGTYDATKDRRALGRWQASSRSGSAGTYHRAVRLAQGGQLLAGQGLFQEASDRFKDALRYDPANPGIWIALANAESRLENDLIALTSARIAMRLASGNDTMVQAASAAASRLASGNLGSQAAAMLCSLSLANPHSARLAAEAIRAALLAEQPTYALECLAAYSGPETAELLNLEGSALLLQGRFRDAEARFRSALDLASPEPALQQRIVGNLLLCLHRSGRETEAAELSEAWRQRHSEADE